LLAVGASVLVVVLIVALVVVKAMTNSTSPAATPAAPNATASTSALAQLAGIPASALARAVQVAKVSGPTAIKAAPLTEGTKPEILYIGAEYCPYCAAERWAMVTALSHFGQFSGIGATTSSATDVFPNSTTFSFHGATYSSPYLAFASVEETTNQRTSTGYGPLEQPTAAQQKLLDSYGNGGIPFVDLGGRYVSGATFSPAVLTGLSMADIATAAAQGTSGAGQAIQAAAGAITAAICQLTGNQPTAVCASFGGTTSGR